MPDDKVSVGLNVSLWTVSVVVGFCFVPYLDIFPGGRNEPPEIFKPLMFDCFAAGGICWLLGAMLGERLTVKTTWNLPVDPTR